MAKTISIEALKAQDISIDTGVKLAGKSLKTYYLTGQGIRNQVQSRVETSGNLLVSLPSLSVGKYSLIVTDGRMTIYVASITAINKIESTVTKEFIEETLTGEITSHTHPTLSDSTVTVTAAYQMLSTDKVVICNSVSPFTVTLPATLVGSKFEISNINTGIVAIEGSGSDTIDGELNQSIGQWESITVRCFASNLWIIT